MHFKLRGNEVRTRSWAILSESVSQKLKVGAFLLGTIVLLLLSAGRLQAQSGMLNKDGGRMTCASDDGRRHYCPVNTSQGVRLVNQRSQTACVQGSTWGFDRRGVWVDRGCRADFFVPAEQRGGGGPGYGPGPGRPPFNAPTINCSSNDGRRNYCSADTSRGVTLVRQISGSPCVQGSTWGYDRRGVWVDRGCRADFRLSGR